MGSTGSGQVLRRWLTRHPIPYLTQGSTLSIRSTVAGTALRIRTQWRDDGIASYIRWEKPDDVPSFLTVVRNVDRQTSMGRQEAHVSVELHHGGYPKEGSAFQAEQVARPGEDYVHPLDAVDTSDGDGIPTLTLDVPEKINVDCDLKEGGTVAIESKIEGDVRIKIRNGTISLTKVRGHNIDLHIEGSRDTRHRLSTIFVSELLESQSLRISLPGTPWSRIRAKRIHANTMNIQLGGDNFGDGKTEEIVRHDGGKQLSSASNLGDVADRSCDPNGDESRRSFDDDDSGASCDISSLYMVDDAYVSVTSFQPCERHEVESRTPRPQAVRIKSHHGHVVVEASTPPPDIQNPITGETLPIVDMGGVNGSCDVLVSPRSPNGRLGDDGSTLGSNKGWTSCHVHFDSVARDSVSVLQSESGTVHVTVDRKVEADVRMLSPPPDAYADADPATDQRHVNMDTLILEDNEDGSVADELRRLLHDLDGAAKQSSKESGEVGSSRIRIQTKAFTPRDRQPLKHCEFIDGWVENTSNEPDSRFDRKVRGITEQPQQLGGGGKIRLEGAYDQALHGFQQRTTEGFSQRTPSRPLLAICSPDGIVLESLSWLGNIARRYGLDESREKDDLGRQATRRGRLLEPRIDPPIENGGSVS